jgi:glycine/serine hydroxymethyltransferase
MAKAYLNGKSGSAEFDPIAGAVVMCHTIGLVLDDVAAQMVDPTETGDPNTHTDELTLEGEHGALVIGRSKPIRDIGETIEEAELPQEEIQDSESVHVHPPEDLEELTVPKLKYYASELELKIPSKAKKDDIIKAIKKHLKKATK